MMYSDIFIFGDSFMAGDELATDTITDIKSVLSKQFPKETFEIHNTGLLLLQKIKNLAEVMNFIDSYTNEYFNKNADQECRNLSFGNKLANKLGIPAHNYASGGASFVRILDSIMLHIDEIHAAKRPLVLVGLTGVDRPSKFMKDFEYGSTKTNIHTTILSFSNPHATGGYKRRLEEYKMLNLEFGDDSLSKIYHKLAFALSYKELLKNIDHVLFDNVSDIINTEKYFSYYCSHVFYDNLTPDDFRITQANNARNSLLHNISDIALADISKNAYNSTGEACSCLFGHPKQKYHNVVADILYNRAVNGTVCNTVLF